MEILATNTSYTGAIWITVFFGLIAVVALIVANDKEQDGFERALRSIAGTFAILMVLAAWYGGGGTVTYDAIVTDWNAVYEQGYEVVKTNGKIVTLRKVGD